MSLTVGNSFTTRLAFGDNSPKTEGNRKPDPKAAEVMERLQEQENKMQERRDLMTDAFSKEPEGQQEDWATETIKSFEEQDKKIKEKKELNEQGLALMG